MEESKKQGSRAKQIKSKKLDKFKPEQVTGEDKDKAKIVNKEKKKKSRARGCCWGCSIITLLVILFILYVISASGLAQLPIFSHIFYGHGPEPNRKVEANSQIQDQFQEKVAKAVIGGSDRLVLSESELTGLLASNNILEHPNLAIEDEYMEIFGKVGDQNYSNLYLTVKIMPSIENNKLHADIKGLKIGKFPIPAFFADYIVDRALTNYQGNLEKTTKKIDQLNLKDHQLIIEGDIQNLFVNKKNNQQIPQDIPESVDPKDLQSITPPGE